MRSSRTRMTEDHAARRKDFMRATGSSSRSSSAAAAAAEIDDTGARLTSAAALFFSLAESSMEPDRWDVPFSCMTAMGRLIARVASKSKLSGH